MGSGKGELGRGRGPALVGGPRQSGADRSGTFGPRSTSVLMALRLLLLALAVAAAGCDGAAAVDTDPAGTAGTIEGPLVLRLVELQTHGAAPVPPQPTLAIATEAVYPCVNYRIDLDVRPSDGAVDVVVLGVPEPEGVPHGARAGHGHGAADHARRDVPAPDRPRRGVGPVRPDRRGGPGCGWTRCGRR